MSHLIKEKDSLGALYKLLSLLLNEGVFYNDRIEILNVLVSIGEMENIGLMGKFIPFFKKIVGTEYWIRAEKLYCSESNLKWKTSYRGRLTVSSSGKETNQLKNILKTLIKNPNANTLSFTFFRPDDHVRASAIPASMPCPIAGDLKFREGKLHLNILFRSIDAFRLAFADIFFLRRLQKEILSEIQSWLDKYCSIAEIGELNLFLSRAFILKRHREKAKKLIEAILNFKKELGDDYE